jgi:hypothetical protein
MSNRRIISILFAFTALTLLAACGPEVSPSPTPTESPTGTPVPSVPTPTAPSADEPVAFHEGFEGTLDGWQRGADVPEDPNQPGQPVDWRIELSSDQVAEGTASARFTLDGSQDDGTIWLMRPLDVPPEEPLRVELSFELWSASESFNTLANIAAYAGSEPPGEENDFNLHQTANQVEGWKTYEYAFDVHSNAEGQLWVALGVSVVWETEITYYVDNVHVRAAPADAGQAPGGEIEVTGVHVTESQVVARGMTTLPDDTCVRTELWADGAPLTWWPTDACAPISDGAWQLAVPMEDDQVLQPGVQYMVRAYQPGGPNVVSTFPFDLDGPPTPPPGDDALLLLPESAEPLHQTSADLDGDGTSETVVLAGWGGGANQLGYDFLQLFAIAAAGDGEVAIAWQSEQLPTDRAESLQVEDLNDDGLPEVLSVQAIGASGERLYVLSWQDGDYGWLTPHGGRFDGQEAFGEKGARWADVDDDGLVEILAGYGPAASQTDVYGWDGEAYVYRETYDSASVGYVRETVAEAGLSLEVPAAWTQIEPGTWAALENGDLRVGVRWADLEPLQEPEAVLLPRPSQVLSSEPAAMPWGSGRRVTVEVYGEAAAGEAQVPVEAVESHVLVVVEQNGARRAIDVYIGAPSAERLANLEDVLQRTASSVTFE